jgi:hypothetical protein
MRTPPAIVDVRVVVHANTVHEEERISEWEKIGNWKFPMGKKEGLRWGGYFPRQATRIYRAEEG